VLHSAALARSRPIVQAVAAMAWGTASCPKVDKILGPGNQFVTAAKMLLQNSEAMVCVGTRVLDMVNTCLYTCLVDSGGDSIAIGEHS